MSGGSMIVPPTRGRFVRRLSSDNANELGAAARGPTVIVPPSQLMASEEANETAKAMELARFELEDLASPEESPATPAESSVTDRYAFAFDIDGVLIRGGRPIPQAVEAMKVLNGHNPYGIKIPYIFVTNGGGKSEEERCIQLSQQLDIEVSPGQFICGHTPMREMAEQYKTVLVVGGEGEKCRQVAEDYGFRDVVTPGDIIKANPDTTPFRKLTEEELENSRMRNYAETPIDAIFVFADSRDWAGDQQIILDLLMSKKGYLGTRSETFDEGPPVYFSHNDIVWSASHELTRLGMGALRLSIEAMFKAVTGKDLVTVAFGKPQIGTFQFATRLLQQWRKATHGINAPPETVYFVGDTPESDIRGTNEFNETSKNTWFSILVQTGVYEAGSTPKFVPKHTCDTVLDAVNFAVEREHRNQMMQELKMSNGPTNGDTHAVDDALISPPADTVTNPMERLKV